MKHLLSIEELSAAEISGLIANAQSLKAERGKHASQPLAGQTWAMIFSKSSTRTRVSFEVGIRELGGSPMFLSNHDIQLGRGEPIKDTARVLGRMVHGMIIRTFAQQDIIEFANYSNLPVINALTDDEHPCQILADLLTVREKIGGKLTIASPLACQPPASFLKTLNYDGLKITTYPAEAVKDADVINTDVWLSMGQEGQKEKEAEFAGFEVNAPLLKSASPCHIVLHCLPAYRGKEISDEVLEAHADTIFQQAENRLHAQKAVLVALAKA